MTRRCLRPIGLSVPLAVLLVGLVGGCHKDDVTRGERLVVARATDAISLDPARTSDNESIEATSQIFGCLVRFAAGKLEPEADLATTWSVSSDGLRWTFELRPGLVFHDGTPVDADAVVFSFERQIDKNHPNHEKDFAWLGSYQMIKRVRAKTPLSVEFEIDHAYAPFLANLAMSPAAIVSPTAVKKWGSDFGHHPVGAGPYRFVEWIEGDRITLERNPSYWDERAHTKTLVFQTVRDARDRLRALETATADVVEQLAPEDLSLVRLHPDIHLLTEEAATVSYLAMNTQKPPFDDPRVRRAVAHAIRRDAIVSSIYQGLASAAVGPLPDSLWGARKDVVAYPFDPARSRELLAEAGYKPTRTLKLYAPSVPRQYLPSPDRLAGIIKASLAEVGIPVDVELSGFREHLRATSVGEHDLALLGWVGDNGDPDNFLYTLLDSDNAYPGGSSQNIAFYKSPRFHELMLAAQRTSARVERERFYSEAQALLAVDAPWVPLAHTRIVFATGPGVSGVIVQPSGLALFRQAEIVQ